MSEFANFKQSCINRGIVKVSDRPCIKCGGKTLLVRSPDQTYKQMTTCGECDIKEAKIHELRKRDAFFSENLDSIRAEKQRKTTTRGKDGLK